MKIYTRLVATTLSVTLATTAVQATAEENQPFTKVVAGYTVNADPAARTCSITPTQAAKDQATKLGDAMWPGAEAAILSTGQSWAQDEADKINAARKAGHQPGDVEVTTPMAALEAATVLKVGKDAAGALKILKAIPGIGALLSFIPAGAEGIADTVFDLIGSFIQTDKLMLPGELASRFVNPAVEASTTFVSADGKTFTVDEAKKELDKYQGQLDDPVYGRVPLAGNALTQTKALPGEFKNAWAAYNKDAVRVLSACLPSNQTKDPETETPTTEPSTTQAPTTQEPGTETPTTDTPTTQEPTTPAPTTQEPTTPAPSTDDEATPSDPDTQTPNDNLDKPGVGPEDDTTGGNGGNGGTTTKDDNSSNSSKDDSSSQIEAADKASSLVGNEGGASKAVGIGVGVGVFLLLGFLLAAIPWLKPILPPQIAKMIP